MLDTKGHLTDFMSVPIALPLERISAYRALLSVKESQDRKCWHAVHVRYKYSLVMAGGLGDLRLTGDTVLSHASLLGNSWEVTTEQITIHKAKPKNKACPSSSGGPVGCSMV